MSAVAVKSRWYLTRRERMSKFSKIQILSRHRSDTTIHCCQAHANHHRRRHHPDNALEVRGQDDTNALIAAGRAGKRFAIVQQLAWLASVIVCNLRPPLCFSCRPIKSSAKIKKIKKQKGKHKNTNNKFLSFVDLVHCVSGPAAPVPLPYPNFSHGDLKSKFLVRDGHRSINLKSGSLSPRPWLTRRCRPGASFSTAKS